RFRTVSRKPPDSNSGKHGQQHGPNPYPTCFRGKALMAPFRSRRCEGLGTGLVHRSDEAIAAARESLHKRGIVGFVSQCESNLGNRCIESVVKIDEGVFGPDLLTQFFPSDQVARVCQQDRADLKRLALQRYFYPTLA